MAMFPPKKPSDDDALSMVMGGAPAEEGEGTPDEEAKDEEETSDPVALLDDIQERVAKLRESLTSA